MAKDRSELIRKIAMQKDYHAIVLNTSPVGVVMNEVTRKKLDDECISHGLETCARTKVFGLKVYTTEDLKDMTFLFVVES